MQPEWTQLNNAVDSTSLYQIGGRLLSATGLLTCSLQGAIGDQCVIRRPHTADALAEIIGFQQGTASLMCYDSAHGLREGMAVLWKGPQLAVPAGPGVLGRVIDALGRAVDGKQPLHSGTFWPVRRESPAALERCRIDRVFETGLRAVDGLLTCGRGQRLGIFAGGGVGKSTMLGEIAKGSAADVNVIALIGERGREVKPFLDDCLGQQGMKRSAVVVATSDQTPLMRVRAAQTAVAIADYFREQGASVLFLLDSLTRLAMAQREIGLLLREPPSSRGYPPSVFQLLAATIERLGNSARGSITALLTVLVDGDDLDEPVSDAIRALVDGHIVLNRDIAERGVYPAIDIGRSISRAARDVIDPAHAEAAQKVRAILATHAEVEDLIRLGAYTAGTSQAIDKARELLPVIEKFLRQTMDERSAFAETKRQLLEIASQWPW